jgi:hypothetical protein
MKKNLIVLLILPLLVACTTGSEDVRLTKYFDSKALVERQITLLLKGSVGVLKTVSIGDKVEEKKIEKLDWRKELEIFSSIDLNKQSYVNSYTIEKSDTLWVYKLKETENLPIKLVQIHYNLLKEVVGIDAQISNKNYLYASEKKIKLNLIQGSISDYEIVGFQQLVFSDKKIFKIRGFIKR